MEERRLQLEMDRRENQDLDKLDINVLNQNDFEVPMPTSKISKVYSKRSGAIKDFFS